MRVSLQREVYTFMIHKAQTIKTKIDRWESITEKFQSHKEHSRWKGPPRKGINTESQWVNMENEELLQLNNSKTKTQLKTHKGRLGQEEKHQSNLQDESAVHKLRRLLVRMWRDLIHCVLDGCLTWCSHCGKRYRSQRKDSKLGWEYSSAAQCLPSLCETQGSIPGATKQHNTIKPN